MTSDLAIEQQRAIALANARRRQAQESPENLGFLARIGEEMQEREANVQEILRFGREGAQTPLETGFQQAGQGAGFLGDVAGEALISAGRGISAVTPEPVRQFVGEQAQEIGSDIAESELFQAGINALQAGGEIYQGFKEANPRIARNLEALVNVGIIAAPLPKGAPRPPTSPTVLGKAGERLGKAATRQKTAQKIDFVSDLVEPKLTPTVAAQRIKQTREARGLLGGRQIQRSPLEQQAIEEVAKLPVSRNKTLLGNLNVIQDEIATEAKNLTSALKKNNVIFPRREFKVRLNAAKRELAQNPLLTGDAEKSAARVLKIFDDILEENPSNALGLLEARKQLDRRIEQLAGAKVFEGEGRQTAIKEVVRKIRQTTNDFIDEKATDVAVKQSLSKQSALFNAVDNLAPKAAAQGATRFERLLGRLKTNANKLGISGSVFTTGALGTAVVTGAFTPLAIGGGLFLTGRGAVRAALSPQTKKALSNILKVTDKAIRTTKDKDLIRQLRADRAALLSVINTEDQQQEAE